MTLYNLPDIIISTVAIPLLPNASVTEQVWLPESIEWRAVCIRFDALPPRTKQFPVHVDDHW
jgi:hypothetical protein